MECNDMCRTLWNLPQEWCLCWGRWECASWCLCCGGGDEEETPPALCHPHQGSYNLPKDPLQEVSYIDIHRYIAASFQLIQCKQLQDDCSHTGSTFEYEKRTEKYLLFEVPMVRVYYRTYCKNSINASLDFMFTVLQVIWQRYMYVATYRACIYKMSLLSPPLYTGIIQLIIDTRDLSFHWTSLQMWVWSCFRLGQADTPTH